MSLEELYKLKIINPEQLTITNNPNIPLKYGSYFELFEAKSNENKELIFIKLTCQNFNFLKLILLINSLEEQNQFNQKNVKIFLTYKGILIRNMDYYLAFKKPNKSFSKFLNSNKDYSSDSNLSWIIQLSIDLLNLINCLKKHFDYTMVFPFHEELLFLTKKKKLRIIFFSKN
jgi:hypothetical protein